MGQIFTREILGYPMTVELLKAGEDLQVCILGGVSPHIGSVTTAWQTAEGVKLHTWIGLGHRDDVIGDQYAQKIAEATGHTVCVSCGIHYERITKEKIRQVVAESDILLSEILEALAK